MRPYLAIIKDSFLEALASRVLWVLLILITLTLVLLAPLGFCAERTTKFQQNDFRDARELARLVYQDRSNEPSPGHRIWSRLNEKDQKQLIEFQKEEEEEEDRNRMEYYTEVRNFTEALNRLLEKRDLYDPKAWDGVLLGSEARELLGLGTDKLTPDDLARLNRLLIVTPFEDTFRPQPPKQIVISYFGAGISPPIRVSEKRVKQIIEQMILPNLINLLLGFLAVLVAILVTAPIIPQMFDPGALSLLLSKPLSRSMMFLAKFIGGCAFILINVTYLLFGIWSIAGLRFGIWNHGLLFCIPIFLFLFAIYYSVSAFTGVIWRNAVVCVVMTVVFWLVCTIVGGTKGVFEQVAIENRKIVKLVPADDTLISLEEQGVTRQWNSETSEWETVFIENAGGPFDRIHGPIYDAENNLLLATRFGSRGFFGPGGILLIGKGSDGWMKVDGPALPEDTLAILPDPKGRLLAVTEAGVHRLVGDLDLTSKKKVKVFWMEIPQSLEKPFHFSGPESPLRLERPVDIAVDHQTANLAIYSRGNLMMVTRRGDEYEMTKSVKVDADEEEDASIAYQGSTILLAMGDGRILNYDSKTLKLRRADEPEKHSTPRFVYASPDGRWFGIVYHNARLYLLDTKNKDTTVVEADVSGQGNISTVAFLPDNQLLVVDRATRVTRYNLETLANTKVYAPSLTGVEIAYYYVVMPIYTIFPRPGELDYTIQYLLQDDDTVNMAFQQSDDLQARRLRLRPWAPVRSGLIFVIVVLGIACLYIERQDF